MREPRRLFVIFYIVLGGLISCEKNDMNDPSEFDANGSDTSFEVLYELADEYQKKSSYTISWSINGKQLPIESLNQKLKYRIIDQLNPGVNIVCFIASKKDAILEECVEIELIKADKVACPKLFFEAERDKLNSSVYNFHSLFKNVSQTSYWWTIDGVVVDIEIVHHKIVKDDYLKYRFNSGSHTVCMITISESCEEITFCTEINI
ncbi:hypothetical protein ACE939_09120 [Aquimarina sp. W85]|uniref:hypothetical protein n=1 Tax=Aquimarina rhodophyticola TaxID=3342246 RepID=UPI00366C83E8